MPRKKPPTDKAKETFWRKAIERQLQSSLSQSEFCDREGLSANTLGWWKRRIAQLDADKGPKTPASDESFFVPVAPVLNSAALKGDCSGKWIAEIDLASGVIRIFAGIDRYALHELIAAFREVTR